jgi:phage-related minor tail protein
MTDFQGVGDLNSDLETLDGALTTVAKMTAGFGSELNRLTQAFGATERNASAFEISLSSGVRKAINGVAFDDYKLRDSLDVVGQALIDTAFNAAIKPISNHLGGLLAGGLGTAFSSVLPFADGAGFSQGRVMPFASGGIVSGPTLFPMRGGKD